MSKLFEGIALAILGALVAVPITIWLSDPVTDLLAKIFGRLKTEQRTRLSGYWTSKYKQLGENGENVHETQETLSVLQIGDRVVGRRIINATTRKTERAYRLKGKLRRERYVTGEWFDTRANGFYHGAFQFVVEDGGEEIHGKWLGYSSKNFMTTPKNGTWELTRTTAENLLPPAHGGARGR